MDKAESHVAGAALDVTGSKKPLDSWPQMLRRYQSVDSSRATIELFITAVPFGLLWASMLIAIRSGQPWVLALLVVPAAGLLVRLFMIQHDCGHGAFFGSKSRNDWIGRGISVLTLAPYDLWRRSHAIHHATSG